MLKVQTSVGVEIQWKIVEHELFTKVQNSPELQKQYALQLVCENVKSGALKPCTLVGWELAESLEGSSQQVEEGVRQPTVSPDSASTGMEVGEVSTPVVTDETVNENIPDNNILWSWAPTKLLINIRLSMDPDFVRPKCSKKALWSRVSAKMKEKGYTFTDKDCKEKFKNLLATYRRNAAKAGPNGTGEEAIKWPHYQEFKEVFHKKAKINIPPQLLGSSMNPDSISTDISTDISSEKMSEDCSDADDPEPTASTSKEKGKKKRVTMTSKVYYAEKLALERRKLEAKKERDEAREQMKKEYREKKLELLEKLVRNKTGDSS